MTGMETSRRALPELEPLPSATERLPVSGAAVRPPRLGWLDALRGIAALVVVFDHSSYSFMAEFRGELMPDFNTSRCCINRLPCLAPYKASAKGKTNNQQNPQTHLRLITSIVQHSMRTSYLPTS